MDHSSPENIYHFIARLDPFNKLSDETLNYICNYIKISHLAKGESISAEQLSQGYLYIIRSGAIEQLGIDGEFCTKLDRGDVFGYTMMLDGSQQQFQAKALENTLLYMLPNSKFNELRTNSLFASLFATQFQTRLKSALKYSLAPDNALLLQNVDQLCNRQIVIVNSKCSIQEVARKMAKNRNTSAVVVEDEKLVGFVSDRNFTKRVIASGADITLPVSEVMTENPPTIDASDIVLQAVAKMMQYSIRNLPVMRGEHVVGVVNASDLVQKHSAQAVFLIDSIQRQDNLNDLANLMPQRQLIFDALVDSNIRPHLVGQVMTMIADALTTRLIELAEEELIKSGMGEPPCAYAWMVAGSQARYEMQMVSDQDNSIVLAGDATDSDRLYFNRLAVYVCEGLAACGYKLCPGDVMAKNPKWCQPLPIWKEYYTHWITYPELESLLNVSIFMDIRCVHGEVSLVKSLQGHITHLVKGNLRFINALVLNMLKNSPPIGFFRNFVLINNGKNKDTLSIKKRAISPIVDLVRIYGLLAGCEAASTHHRMQTALEQEIINQASYDDLMGAYNFICSVRLHYQLKSLRNGRHANNNLPPKSLSRFERNHLKSAFWIIAMAQEAAKQRYLAPGTLH